MAATRSAFAPLENVSFTGCSVTSDAEPHNMPPPRRCSNPTPPSSNVSRIEERTRSSTVYAASAPPCPEVQRAIPRHYPPHAKYPINGRYPEEAEENSNVGDATDILRQIDDSMNDLCGLLPPAAQQGSNTARGGRPPRHQQVNQSADRSELSDVCAKIDFLAETVLRHERLLRQQQQQQQQSHAVSAVLYNDATQSSSAKSHRSSQPPSQSSTPPRRSAAVPADHPDTIEQPSVLMRSILEKVDTVNTMLERLGSTPPHAATSQGSELHHATSRASLNEATNATALSRVADALEALSVQVARQNLAIEQLEHTAYRQELSLTQGASLPRASVEPADNFVADRSALFPPRASLGEYLEYADRYVAAGNEEAEDTEMNSSPARQRLPTVDGFIEPDERSPARQRDLSTLLRAVAAAEEDAAAASGFIAPDERSPPRQRDTSSFMQLQRDGYIESDERSPARQRGGDTSSFLHRGPRDGYIESDERSPARARSSAAGTAPPSPSARGHDDSERSGLIPSDERSPARQRYVAPARMYEDAMMATGYLPANELSPARTARRRVSSVDSDLAFDHIEEPTSGAFRSVQRSARGAAATSAPPAYLAGSTSRKATAAKVFDADVSASYAGDAPKPLYYASPVTTTKKKPTTRSLFSSSKVPMMMRPVDESDASSSVSSANSVPSTRTTTDVQNELEARLRAENESLKAQLLQQLSLNDRLRASAMGGAMARAF